MEVGGDTMTKEKSFIVRIDENELKDFNEILKRKNINRSELFRSWIREYVKKENNQDQ